MTWPTIISLLVTIVNVAIVVGSWWLIIRTEKRRRWRAFYTAVEKRVYTRAQFDMAVGDLKAYKERMMLRDRIVSRSLRYHP